MQRLLLGIAILFIATTLFSQKDQRLAKGLIPADQLSAVRMPAQDNAALLEAELARRGPGVAPRYATNIEVDLSPANSGTWESTPNGQVWRLRIHSNAAHSINLGFTEYFMPKGGQLMLYTPDYKEVRGPFTPADNEDHEQLWTPLLTGDEIVIEVQLPDAVADQLRLKLSYVNHAFEDFTSLISGSCNLDVICGTADGWGIVEPHRDIIQSVAVISTGGGTFCTGFLVNNVENDCKPFFMTAFHCGINAGNAPSLVTYWNFQNSTCRQPFSAASGGAGDGQLNDFNTGSIFRSRRSQSDFVLVELDDPVSPTANAYLAGWDASGAAISNSIGIHHPRTDEKRISFENDASTFTTYGGTTPTSNFTHVRVIDWDVGTTEPGSSGSPLFDQDERVVGQLHGGGAACGNNSSDWYGAFAVSWDAGGNANSRLRDWLDPNNTGTLTINGRWANDCGFSLSANPVDQEVCQPDDAFYDIEVNGDFSGNVTLSADDLPPGAAAFFSPTVLSPGETSLLTLQTSGADPGDYSFTVEATNGSETTQITLSVSILPDPSIPPTLIEPANNSLDEFPNPVLEWDGDDSGATNYEVQIATDINFTNIVETGMTTALTYQPVNANQGATRYYWRVRAMNDCGTSFWADEFNFTTDNISCITYTSNFSTTISDSGTPTVENDISFNDDEEIFSVMVMMEVTHTYVGDLDAVLFPASGGSISLFDRPGFPSGQFGCSEDNLNLSFSASSPNSATALENTCNTSQTGANNPGAPYAIEGSFQAIDNLDDLIGESSAGQWTLQLNDNATSDGGILEEWSVTVCYEIPSTPPFLLTNEMLLVPHNTSEIITNAYLEASDDMSSADEIFFTLTDMPNEGMLFLNGVMLNLGDSFTQADIDDGLLSYQHEGGVVLMDEFVFDLENAAGLVTPNNVFQIEILIEPLVVDYNQLQENACHGNANASIEVLAEGGVMPYEYSLNNGDFQADNVFTGLSAGSYVVSVQDMTGNVVSTNSFLIMQPEELMAMAAVDDDQITITPMGGTPAYTYQLNDNTPQSSAVFPDLDNGTYTITVTDANGCQTTVMATVAVNTLAITASVVQQVTCHDADDGIITALVSGGTMPYQYRLNGGTLQPEPTFTNLAPGTYTVEVLDGEGFTRSSSTLTITNPPLLTLSAAVNVNTITLSAGGGTPPLMYQLNDGTPQSSPVFSDLANGTYMLTVIDANDCTTSTTAIVAVNSLVVSASLVNNISCFNANDGTITVNAAGGTEPYEYSLDGINFQTDNSFGGLAAGTYTVTVRDSEGFTRTTNSVNITNPTAISGSLTVMERTITVTASGGTAPLMYQLADGTPQSSPVFNDVANGTYAVTIIDANGCELELSATVAVNTLVVSASLVNDISCFNANDGTITVNVSGGTAPYQYSLDGANFQTDNSFGGLAAGTYTVTVMDGEGFTQTTNSITITNPPALSGSVAVVVRTIAVSATGGTVPYMYQLEDGTPQSNPVFTDVPNGTYTITVIDANGCEFELSATVAVNTLVVSTGLVSDISCFNANDGIISVTVNGGTAPFEYSLDGVNYQPENTFTNLAPGIYTVTVRDSEGFTRVTNSITITNPVELLGSVDVTDNTITVVAGGGTGSLNYQLNDGTPQASPIFEDVPNGTYEVRVIDANGCVLVLNATVAVNSLVVSLEIINDMSCFNVNDGQIEALVSGGTPPYEYSLNGTTFQSSSIFAGLAPGEYTVTVRDADGFTRETGSITITNPPLLMMSVMVEGDSVMITASGGTGDLEYSVDGINFQAEPLFPDLPTGEYQVTVRDENGCAIVTQVAIGTTLSVSFEVSGLVNCFGEPGMTISITATGGTPPYLYSIDGGQTWFNSNIFTNLSGGTYEVQVMDAMGDIVGLQAFTIAEPDELTVSTEINGDDITATGVGGVPPYVYSLDGMAFSSENTFSDLPVGTYEVWVEDANGCRSSTIVDVLVNVFEVEQPTLDFTLYPNPNTGQFFLRLEQEQASDITIQVFDARGRLIQRELHQNTGLVFAKQFDLTALPAGVYQLLLDNGVQFGRTKVVVIK
ncbi:MAG: T9SS type A sorting domain-containing protein [Bacteroidota bacterium]